MFRMLFFLFFLSFSPSVFAVSFSVALSSCQNSAWWGNSNYRDKYCTTLTSTKLVKLMGYGVTNGILYTMQSWGYSGAECDVGELNLSTNICEVTCSDGSKAPTLAQCSVQCTRPQYDLNGTCTNPPDCNASYPAGTGGAYFDYVSGTCMAESEHTACIGTNDKYCPPIADCKPTGYICTNDSDAVNQATLARSAAFAAAKARADEAAAKAAAAAANAEKAAAARTQEHERLTALKSAAKEALDHSQANPDTSAADLRHAVENYAAALRGLADATTQADNSRTSSDQTAQHANNAQQYAGAVPGSATSGHAGDNADKAEQEATAADGTALDSVAAGGPGSGDDVQNSDGAKEATLEKVLDSLTGHSTPGTYTAGTANGGSSERGNLTASITDGEAQIEAGKLELSNKITEIRSGLSAIGGNVDSGVGTLPVIDVGEMKGKHVVIDLNRNAEQLQVVSTIIIALAWLSAFSIVLSR